ncbi:MAG: hypothetical protein HY420_00665 [Candidatus Kerfeldbacteria bacterium]|nr:hypothetical protein [Candidatus Kerfeldbacteria bacterium]
MTDELQVHSRLRQIRWILLDVYDRLVVERRHAAAQPTVSHLAMIPFLWALQVILGLIVNLVSVPLYLTGAPQATFPRYARRRGDTYLDSYAKFKRAAQFTVGVIIVTIVAVTLAVMFGTFVRTKLRS